LDPQQKRKRGDLREFDIIIPIYNCAAILPVLTEKIAAGMATFSGQYRVIFVDDGSEDASWKEIEIQHRNCNWITGLRFDKNYGQHQAIRAGLEYARAKWCFVMDGDLQDNPAYLPDMYRKAIAEEVEVVLADRRVKIGSAYYKLNAWLFNNVLSVLMMQRIHYRTANFGIYSRAVIEKIRNLPYRNFYLPIAVRRCTNSITTIEVKHNVRYTGDSSYNFIKLIALAGGAMAFVFQNKKNDRPGYTISEIVE